jgi:hypothetical protein
MLTSFSKLLDIKFHENSLSGSPVVTRDRRTHTGLHGEDNSRMFATFRCERANKKKTGKIEGQYLQLTP